MSNEYSIVASVDASGAAIGAREFKRSLADIVQSATKIEKATDGARAGFRRLGDTAKNGGGRIADDFRRSAQSITNSAARVEAQTGRAATALATYSRSAISSTTYLANQYRALPQTVGQSLRQVEAHTSRAGQSFMSLGSILTRVKGLLLGFAVGFSLANVVGQISNFEASMSRINALLGKSAAPGELKEITAAARELGATTVFSASQAAEGMTELVKAGMSAKEAIEAGRATLNLASADNLSLGESASIAANMLSMFTLSADQAGRVADTLAFAANKSQSDVRGLADGMKYVGPVAATLGVSLEDTAAAMSTLSNAGIDASMAGTGLRQILSGLLTPTTQSRKAMEGLGLSVEEIKGMLSQEGGLVKMVEAFGTAQRKMGNDTEFAAKVMQVLGDRGGPALLAMVKLAPGMRDLTESMGGAAGTAQEMADAMTDNFKGDIAEVSSAFEELTLQVGDAGVAGAMREGAQAVGAFLRGLAGLGESNKATASMKNLNDMGMALSRNIHMIKDAVLVLASVLISRYVVSMAAAAVATTRAALTQAALTASSAAAILSTNGLATASVRSSAAMAAGTVVANGLRVALAAMGGPVGLLVIGLTALVSSMFLFNDLSDKAGNQTDSLRGKLDQITGSYGRLTLATRAAALEQVKLTALQTKERAADIGSTLRDDQAKRNRVKEIELTPMLSSNPFALLEKKSIEGKLLSESERASLLIEAKEVKALADDLGKSVTKLSGDFYNVTTSVNATTPAITDLAVPITDMAEGSKKAAAELDKFKAAAISALGASSELTKITLEYNEKMAVLQELSKKTTPEIQALGVEFQNMTNADVLAAMDSLTANFQKQAITLDPVLSKFKDLSANLKDAAKSARPLDALMEESTVTQELYNAALALTDEQLKTLKVTREQIQQGILDNNTALQEGIKNINSNKKQADPWAKAWESAIGRLDSLFVDLWGSAFDGFKGFKDKLVDTFKQMLAELANAATTRAITGWLSKFLGEPGAGGAGKMIQAGVGAVVQGGQGFLEVSNGAGGTTSSIQTGVGAASGGGSGGASGYTQIGGLIAKGFVKYGSQISGFASAAAPYVAGAAGLAGAYYGYKNAGSGGASSVAAGLSYGALGYAGATVGIGALAGGAAGAATGVAGAATGGAMAGGMGAAAAIPVVGWVLAAMALIDLASGGKLFGTKYTAKGVATTLSLGADGGTASTTIRESRQKALFGGRKERFRDVAGSPEALKAAKELFDSVTNVMEEAAKALKIEAPAMINAAFKTSQELDKKGKPKGEAVHTVTANGTTRTVKDVEEGMRWISAEAIYAVIEKAFPKADAIRAMWGDSLEALEEGVKTFMGLLTAIAMDPAGDAKKAFEDTQKSGLELYKAQAVAYGELLTKFDGSLASITTLSEATQALKKSQYDLALAYYQVKEQGASMFGGTRQNIRESLMGTEELYGLRRTQISELMTQMGGETDPAKLQALAEEINRLATDAYNMLDGDQQATMAPEFLTFLEQAEALLMDRVGVGLDGVNADSAETTRLAMEALNMAADKNTTSVNLFADAVNRFSEKVGGGSGGGGSKNQYSELQML